MQLELINLSTLPGQWAPGFHLPLPLQDWNCTPRFFVEVLGILVLILIRQALYQPSHLPSPLPGCEAVAPAEAPPICRELTGLQKPPSQLPCILEQAKSFKIAILAAPQLKGKQRTPGWQLRIWVWRGEFSTVWMSSFSSLETKKTPGLIDSTGEG